MKVLWYSNSVWANSGYGRCAKYITYGLAKAGYQVGHQTNFGLIGGIVNDGMITHYPQGGGFSEGELFSNYVADKFDMAILQYDIWALDSIPDRIRQTNAVICPYVPLDHEFISPRLKSKLDASFELIAMCDYGEKLLRADGYKNVRTIYHGVDTEFYKPSEKPKEQCKQLIGFSGKDFVIGMVAMNRTGRKDIPRQLEAIATFKNNHPELSTKLYLHTNLFQPDGDRLKDIIDYLGLGDCVRTPADREYALGYTDVEMSTVYNGCDVMLQASQSEGFGMPIVEAMACGTPVITSNTTAMTEMIQPVTPEFLVQPLDTTWIGSIPAKVAIMDRKSMVEKLELAASMDLLSMRDNLSSYAHNKYDWNKIIPQWVKLVEDVGQRIEDECIKVPEV